MHISTKRELIWSDKQNRYILLRDLRRPLFGQVAWCKGASSQQTDLANSQQNFYNTLSSDYSQQFANQNAILSTLQSSLNPIVQAGPNQFGFSTAETNNLNAQARDLRKAPAGLICEGDKGPEKIGQRFPQRKKVSMLKKSLARVVLFQHRDKRHSINFRW